MVKAEVCKTSIQRFESARRLHARRWLIAWLVSIVVLAAQPGSVVAGQIVQFKPYSGSFDAIAYDPFDPVSGTLDQVRVSIDGTLSGVVITPPNLVGPGGTPVPYSVTVQVEQLWFGQGDRGFDFNTPALLTLPRTATGAGGAFGFSQPYSISFRFDAATDLIGFAPAAASGVQPPLTVLGRRSDFIESVNPNNRVDYVNTLSTVGPFALPAGPAQSGGILTLDYRFTPPPPTFPSLVFRPINPPLLPGPLVSTVGTASYLGIDTGLLTDSSSRRSAEVRGSISPGENLLTDQSGARAAAEIGGQVRALARAAGQPPAIPAGDPSLSASSTARQVSQWLVMSDSLAPGTVVAVDVLLQVEGSLQAAEGNVAPGAPLVAGDVFALVTEQLSLFREGAPGTLLHEGGGTLDAVAGLTETGGWSFSLSPGPLPTASIDEGIVLDDLFTVTIGETFALELSLQTDAFARDPLDRFALADFFEDGRGVSLSLASDDDARFALRAVPGPAAAIPALPLFALVALLLVGRRQRGRSRIRPLRGLAR